jgi:NTP pyrophosphatase (non-canonical NTP hydrolase)
MSNPTSYRELELEVIRWAEARKIIPRSTPVAQTRKTLEESGELLEAAAALKVCDDLAKLFPELSDRVDFVGYRLGWLEKFKDAVGDTYVTVINACALADVDAVSCLAGAYNEIKNRKGTLLPNGIFQKED